MYKTSTNKNRFLVYLSILVILVLLGLSGYLYRQLRIEKKANNSTASSQEAVKKESEDLKNKISKLMSLPNETPVVGTVNDKDKFKDQPFFSGVENGDKLLIFAEAKKAVIYREKDNRIINAGPIAVTSEKSAEEPKKDNTESTTPAQ